jgi:enterochelin esterase-like enzyme
MCIKAFCIKECKLHLLKPACTDFSMTGKTRKFSIFALLIASSLAQAEPPKPSATADLEIVRFESLVFPTPRNLRILLPAEYRLPENRERRYPVLYLNDGQNLFDASASLTGEEWRVDETVSDLIARGKIPPIIVVGIDHGGRRARAREYLPWVDDTLQPPEPDPQGKLYPPFLLDEVVPFVEKNYRVLPGAMNRALGGSSYGAGIALYTVIRRPRSFGALLLESPSIYADQYRLLKEAKQVRAWPQRIYVGTGTVNEPVKDVQWLKDFFQKAGLRESRLRVTIKPGADHSEKSWGERLAAALEFLFAP